MTLEVLKRDISAFYLMQVFYKHAFVSPNPEVSPGAPKDRCQPLHPLRKWCSRIVQCLTSCYRCVHTDVEGSPVLRFSCRSGLLPSPICKTVIYRVASCNRGDFHNGFRVCIAHPKASFI